MKLRNTALGVILGFLFLAISGCGQKNPATSVEAKAPAAPATPASAPLGAPVGSAATATIGLGGGELRSTDGRVSIEVPPGAVFGDTPFAVQPYDNTEPGGIGPIYVLSPEGQTFAQPVTLAWHLSDADLAGHPIDAVSIASRDADGNWMPQPGVERDPAAKIVRVTTVHLSSWDAYLPDLKITPDHAEVRVKKSIALKVSREESKEDDLAAPRPATPPQGSSGVSDAELLAPPRPAAPAQASSGASDADLLAAPRPKTDCVWKLNGNSGAGDDVSGRIQVDNKVTVTYTAPAKVPPKNPVTVSCEEVMTVKGRKAKMIAVAYITVTDQAGWKGVINYEFSNTTQTSDGRVTNIQEETRHVNGSFDLEVIPHGFGTLGGKGTATLAQTMKSTMTNPICGNKGVRSLSGALEVDADGSAGSGAGALSLILHGENLAGTTQMQENCSKKGSNSTDSWGNGGFSLSCHFVGVDFDKGGIYTSPVDIDRGKGTCKVQIEPN